MSQKLHIPSGFAATACGRQLNNHRDARAQDAANAAIASTTGEYLQALQDGKACRHCGRVAGLVPKLVRVTRNTSDEESEGEE